MKELVINADDFGLSSGVNRGIIKAWREGILTSASLMVGGSSFEEAVQLANENPGLQVGLHLTLVQGRGIVEHEGSPSITDFMGNFTDDPVLAGIRYFFLKKLRSQLYREIEGQIVRFKESGLNLSHIDGHLNIHMHPVIFDILYELMPRHGIISFRLSRERLGTDLRIDPRRFLRKATEAFIFSRLSFRCKTGLERLGIKHGVEVKGLLNSGRMSEDYLLNVLDILQEGMTEIYFHPGFLPDDEISRRMPNYRHEEEMNALMSGRVKEKIRELGLSLRNYRGDIKII